MCLHSTIPGLDNEFIGCQAFSTWLRYNISITHLDHHVVDKSRLRQILPIRHPVNASSLTNLAASGVKSSTTPGWILTREAKAWNEHPD